MRDGTSALRDEICRVGRSLFERGLAHGSAGNISARLPRDGGTLITPTDACLGFLESERLAHVGADGVQRGGDKASKTLALHRRIYEADEQAGCVIHTHSHHLVLLTLRGVWRRDDIVPALTPYQVMKVGPVPLVPYALPGSPEVAEQVAALIAAHAARGVRLKAVMCERLGPQVWHTDLPHAMATLEELEESARLWLASDCRAEPLEASRIDELRRQFGANG